MTLAKPPGMSRFHFHRVFKAHDRRDAEGLCALPIAPSACATSFAQATR